MSKPEPEMRARLNLTKASALYKIINSYQLCEDDLAEAMVIEQLNKAIIEFLTLNGQGIGGREGTKEALKQKLADEFDWDAAFKSIPDSPGN